jgi:DmsE family decaheme c-type cytochrome
MKRITSVCVALCLALGCSIAVQAIAADAPVLAPPQANGLERDKVCTRCHDENDNKPILSIYQSRHGVKADNRTPSCQSCHGTSDAHVKNAAGASTRPSPDIVFGTKKGDAPVPPSSPQAQSESCLTCHRSGLRDHWEGSQHQSRDIPCASCHTAHTPKDKILVKVTQPEVCFTCHKTQRAQTHRISTHPLDVGKMACSDCHNPHGSTGPNMLVKNSVNETCYQCHAEKRGPFLWEHGPVTDDCTNCHTPHGSVNKPLLKTRVPFLCQECHSGDHGAQLNSGANLAGGNLTTINGINPLANASARIQMAGRACLNCHILVHGSNHPAGAKFQR